MSFLKLVKSLSVTSVSVLLFVGVGVSASIIEGMPNGPCQYNDNNLPPTTECHYDPIRNSQSCLIIDWCPDEEPANQ